MTEHEKRILRAGLMSVEEKINEVITEYLQGSCIKDGGEELVSLALRAVWDRYEDLCAGEADELLAIWRRAVN